MLELVRLTLMRFLQLYSINRWAMRYLGTYAEFETGKPTTVYSVKFDTDIILSGITVSTTETALNNSYTIKYGKKTLCRTIPDLGCVTEFKLRKAEVLTKGDVLSVEYANNTGIDGGMGIIIEGDGL